MATCFCIGRDKPECCYNKKEIQKNINIPQNPSQTIKYDIHEYESMQKSITQAMANDDRAVRFIKKLIHDEVKKQLKEAFIKD